MKVYAIMVKEFVRSEPELKCIVESKQRALEVIKESRCQMDDDDEPNYAEYVEYDTERPFVKEYTARMDENGQVVSKREGVNWDRDIRENYPEGTKYVSSMSYLGRYSGISYESMDDARRLARELVMREVSSFGLTEEAAG